jgi:SSS family solute:Na+ symporter
VTSSTIVMSICGVYLVACLVVGLSAAKKSSSSAVGYVAGDRAMGTMVMYFITGATIFSAFAFLGAPGWAYSRGLAVLYIVGFGTLGFIPFYFLGPRAARVGREFGFVTQAEMVASRFRMPSLAGIMAIISTVAFVPYLAVQMKGAGHVLESMTRGAVSREAGAAIVYGVVLIYVLRSGVLGVGWTNTLQGVFMMVLAWIMGLTLPGVLYGGIRPMFEQILSERPELLQPSGLTSAGNSWGWGEYSSAVLVSMIGFSVWPHLFMKAFTAREERTLRRTVVLYPTFQVFLVPIILIGFSGVFFEPAPEAADQIVPHMLMNLDLSPWLVGFFCAGALAASMSSGDTIAHASASVLVRDLYVTAFRRKLSPEKERRAIRFVLVAVMMASYSLAVMSEQGLVALLLFAYGPIVQFAPAVVATLYSRRIRGGTVLLAMLSGVFVNVLLLFRPEWRPLSLHAGIWGLASNLAVIAIGWAFYPAAKNEHEERFVTIAERPQVERS